MNAVPSASRLPPLALLGVFGVALLARLPGLGERSLWLDEDATLAAALAPDVPGVLARVRDVEVGKGPVYYLLLHAFCARFGTTETAVRLPSALLGAAGAAAVALWAMWLVRAFRAGGGRGPRPAADAAVAALAGLVFALHPVAVALGREARAFPLCHLALFLAAAGAVPAYLGGRETPAGARRAWRVGVPVLAALGVSSHLIAAFFAAGLLAAVLLGARALGRPLRPVALGAAAAAVLVLLQAPMTLVQMSVHVTHAAEFALGPRDLGHYARELLGGSPAAYLLLPAAIFTLASSCRSGPTRFAVVAAAVPAAALLLVQFLAAPVLRAGGARYLAFLIGPLAVLLGLGAALRRTTALCLAVVTVGALLLAVREGRAFERAHSEDWRAVGAALAAEARTGDVVVCHAGHAAGILGRYFRGPAPVVTAGGGIEETLADALGRRAPGGRLFLVLSHCGPLDEAERRAEAVLGPGIEIGSQFAIRVLRFSDGVSRGAR